MDMRKVVNLFVLCVISSMMLCCKRNPVIQVDNVKEVDFVNKTGDVLNGVLVDEILGARVIMVYDTLLFVVTTDPQGLLQIFSTNNVHQKLGSFCKQGRAQNEMSRLSFCQAYKKDDHIYLFVIDGGMRICELDITASLEKGATVVTRAKMRPAVELGLDVFIDNDIDYMLDFTDSYSIQFGEKQKTVPSRYLLFKDDKQQNLVFFKSPMNVDESGFVNFPYRGTILKHPSKNIVVNKFSYMDYLLFMDFDNNHNYAIHQQGSMTHEDIYYREDPWIQHFSACTTSEDFFLVYYRNGDYSHIQREGDDYYPELLLFDWEGNYIKGFKMDRNSDSMGFDENNKVLYTMNARTEQLYSYDLSPYLP